MVDNMVDYGVCPNCGSKLMKKEGRNGSFLGCSNFPKCKFSMDYKVENIGIDFNNLKNCPNCGSPLVKRNSRNGPFIGCSNFPDCRFSMDYKSGSIEENLDRGEKCPRCGSKLVERNGKNGPFMGCSNFPKCRFTRDITFKTTDSVQFHQNTKNEPFSFQDDKYKSKVKLAKDFVYKNLAMELTHAYIIEKWDEDLSLCMDILDDKVTSEEEKYIESVLGYARHRRDKRSSLEYACDLMVGWLLEDCIVEVLNNLGYDTSLNGADRNRKLLLDPTTDSDLKVSINGKDILIEQVNDFTGYWIKTKHVPLRDNKYLNLKKENSLLFGIDFKNDLFFILDVSKTNANYIPFHRPFSKPAYALDVSDDDFNDLDKVEYVLSKVLVEC